MVDGSTIMMFFFSSGITELASPTSEGPKQILKSRHSSESILPMILYTGDGSGWIPGAWHLERDPPGTSEPSHQRKSQLEIER